MQRASIEFSGRLLRTRRVTLCVVRSINFGDNEGDDDDDHYLIKGYLTVSC